MTAARIGQRFCGPCLRPGQDGALWGGHVVRGRDPAPVQPTAREAASLEGALRPIRGLRPWGTC